MRSCRTVCQSGGLIEQRHPQASVTIGSQLTSGGFVETARAIAVAVVIRVALWRLDRLLRVRSGWLRGVLGSDLLQLVGQVGRTGSARDTRHLRPPRKFRGHSRRSNRMSSSGTTRENQEELPIARNGRQKCHFDKLDRVGIPAPSRIATRSRSSSSRRCCSSSAASFAAREPGLLRDADWSGAYFLSAQGVRLGGERFFRQYVLLGVQSRHWSRRVDRVCVGSLCEITCIEAKAGPRQADPPATGRGPPHRTRL